MKYNMCFRKLFALILAVISVIVITGCEFDDSASNGLSSPAGDSSSIENNDSSNIIGGSEFDSSSSGGDLDSSSGGSEVIDPITPDPIQSTIKNVIYLIADGLSSSTIDLARELKGDSLYLDEILLGQEMVSTTNLSTLKNAGADEAWKISNTDSSSCGTALATGRKTYKNGQGQVRHDNDQFVPYANDGVKTDWKNGELERLRSIIDLAQDQGKKTAVITTADILDSTPSAFYSHSERGYWDTIYADLKASDIDVLVGTNSYAGNTLSSWRQEFGALGYEKVEYTKKSDLDKVSKGEKYISIADSGNGNHDPFWDYNNYQAGNIRIFEHFSKTLELFEDEEDGFFIMLEGGEIDIGGHNDESQHALSELYAFDETVKLALDFAAVRDDTMVVVTVDHGNSQFHYKNNVSAEDFNLTWTDEAYFYNNFATFTSWMKNNVTKNYDGHTLENVMLGLYVPDAIDNIFDGKSKIENIEIPRYIASLLNIDIDYENRIFNGLEVEEPFGYIVVDFDENLQIGKDNAVSAVSYWGANTSGCGAIKASSVAFHDSENIKGDTCYALRCFNTNNASTGIAITLPSPIGIKQYKLTSLTLRCQISLDAVDSYPMCRIYKGSNEILNNSSTNGVSLAQHANSKVVDVNLGNIDFSKLADSDGIIRSFTINIRTKSIGYIYLDEIRFAYEI